MSIRDLILVKISKKGQITVSEVVKETGFSRAYIHRFFQSLTDEGLIFRIGHTHRSFYVRADKFSILKAKLQVLSFQRIFLVEGLQEDQVLDLIKSETGILSQVPENVIRIVEYAFTEMLNNAIEHSHSKKVKVVIRRDNGLIGFDVTDWGIGIFENLIHFRHLASVEEAVQDLLKGKQTTKPEEHSGEGIFFTRRIADTFVIRSSSKKLFFDNRIDDFTVTTIKPILGTRVSFNLSTDTAKELQQVFNKYTGEEYEFSATEVTVRLYQPGGSFVSRSQARRIFSGLDKFKKIILDFKDVKVIGQGFSHEIFRVWQSKHKDIKIDYTNAGEDVMFMIQRSKNNA